MVVTDYSNWRNNLLLICSRDSHPELLEKTRFLEIPKNYLKISQICHIISPSNVSILSKGLCQIQL